MLTRRLRSTPSTEMLSSTFRISLVFRRSLFHPFEPCTLVPSVAFVVMECSATSLLSNLRRGKAACLLLTPLLWELTDLLEKQWHVLCLVLSSVSVHFAENVAFLAELNDILQSAPIIFEEEASELAEDESSKLE